MKNNNNHNNDNDIIVEITSLTKPLFKLINNLAIPLKIGDRVLTSNNIATIIKTPDHLLEAILHNDRLLIPFIPPHQTS